MLLPHRPSLLGALAHLQAIALHVALLLVFMRHLRLVLNPVPEWVFWLNQWGLWAGYFLPVLLGLRLVRRFWSPGLFRFSGFSNYFPLYLLLATAVTGIMTKLAFPTDLVAVKVTALNFFQFKDMAHAWPGGMFPLHFLLGLVVIAWFPFGKLGHALCLFLNPRFTTKADQGLRQLDNPCHEIMTRPVTEEQETAEQLEAYESLAAYRKRLKERWSRQGVKKVLGSSERRIEHNGKVR